MTAVVAWIEARAICPGNESVNYAWPRTQPIQGEKLGSPLPHVFFFHGCKTVVWCKEGLTSYPALPPRLYLAALEKSPQLFSKVAGLRKAWDRSTCIYIIAIIQAANCEVGSRGNVPARSPRWGSAASAKGAEWDRKEGRDSKAVSPTADQSRASQVRGPAELQWQQPDGHPGKLEEEGGSHPGSQG